jgi:serine protease Do
VTSGIVSALARTSIGITDYRFFIQTDAAINPGNSGGALVSMDGRLVGINTAIYSRSGGSIGIGFAIPSTMVRAVVAAAAKGGPLRRPWLGAEGQAVTSAMAESLGLAKVGGVIITKIHKGSPADDGGLLPKDVILQINGKEVIDGEGLRFRLATLPVGDKATFNVVRQGKPVEVVIDLRAAPEDPPRNEWLVTGQNPLSGAKVANLSPGYAEELGVRDTEGVIVTGIRRGSIAHRIGLRDGDIVLRINDAVIKTVGSVRSAVGGDAYRWLISIRRGQQIITRQLVL